MLQSTFHQGLNAVSIYSTVNFKKLVSQTEYPTIPLASKLTRVCISVCMHIDLDFFNELHRDLLRKKMEIWINVFL